VTVAPETPAVEVANEEGVTGVTPPVTEEGTQITAEFETVPAGPVTPVTPPVTPPVTLEEVAAVAGVDAPTPGDPLTDAQLVVVLRHLRYSDDPPLSYRQAVAAFREGGFVGGEQRVRKAWGSLMSHEESEA
jgi:hypothetical protein